ncbi:6-bladed beta-propeller [Fodinibius salsisoli]|uniref:6-bladed beta-propeller n=1 Tax=Fodinibius salsisoli TaxID=2820877 RepID=A0ABT3PM73_9BACT|nr:6-bladed beta-propeller [Fodinibius salsisoli]MCW9707045.1 6-bladed beta-propeller [Fodinibius salsisoli]
MRYFYSSVVLCILLFACSGQNGPSKSGEKVTTIEVDIDEAEPIRMSEYFSDINYFYLESPDERPIGRVWKMMFQDNYIALYDRARGSIWIYTKEGEFVNEVEIPVGRGPGELTNHEDVIFTKDHKFHILGQLKIVVYGIEGSFVEETAYHFWAYDFTYNPSTKEYIGYASNSLNRDQLNRHGGKNLLYFDKSGEITQSFLSIGKGKEQIGYNIPNNFPTYNGDQLFISHLVDTVYSVHKNGVIPKYALDYGEYAIPQEVFGRRYDYRKNMYNWGEFLEKEIESKDYIAYLSYFNETDKFINFDIGTGEENFVVFYNKNTCETRVASDKMINDIDYGLATYIYEAHDNVLYTVIGANTLLRHLNDLYENEPQKYKSPKMKELRELAHSIDKNRNPILMVMPFKEKNGE